MNAQEQMQRDWWADQRTQGLIREATDALNELLPRFEWRKNLKVLQECILVLEDEDDRIVRRWD